MTLRPLSKFQASVTFTTLPQANSVWAIAIGISPHFVPEIHHFRVIIPYSHPTRRDINITFLNIIFHGKYLFQFQSTCISFEINNKLHKGVYMLGWGKEKRALSKKE